MAAATEQTDRGARIGFVGLVSLVVLSGCVASPDEMPEDAVLRGAASRPGNWRLPADVRAAGAAQYVPYDAAPLWRGGDGCSGGIREGTRELGNYLLKHYPGLRSFGGYVCRQNTADLSRTSVHGTGRAIDLMIPLDSGRADNDIGDPPANWLVVNAELIGVQYIIWERISWCGAISPPKHRDYTGPIPHIDHIHLELTKDGAARRTDWFDDRDGDGIRNGRDNCPNEANSGQADGDDDGIGNRCDNCEEVANSGQADADDDGIGNRCDNCRSVANSGQADADDDGVGNRCDNCREAANSGQVDTDEDGVGDVCDGDDDDDGIADEEDNCPLVANSGQADADGDGVGNRCVDDDDGDGILDGDDNCRRHANPDQADRDGDGQGDGCDDDDDDGVFDGSDNCPEEPNPDQEDLDLDGLGDRCDDDDDGDGVPDADDLCPESFDPEQQDLDGDGLGDPCDLDRDGDGVLDESDVCPDDPDPGQEDRDLDGLGDLCDPAPEVPNEEPRPPPEDIDPDIPVAPGVYGVGGCQCRGAASGRRPGLAPVLALLLALVH